MSSFLQKIQDSTNGIESDVKPRKGPLFICRVWRLGSACARQLFNVSTNIWRRLDTRDRFCPFYKRELLLLPVLLSCVPSPFIKLSTLKDKNVLPSRVDSVSEGSKTHIWQICFPWKCLNLHKSWSDLADVHVSVMCSFLVLRIRIYSDWIITKICDANSNFLSPNCIL